MSQPPVPSNWLLFLQVIRKHRRIKKFAQLNSRTRTRNPDFSIQSFAHGFPNSTPLKQLRLSQKSLPEAINMYYFPSSNLSISLSLYRSVCVSLFYTHTHTPLYLSRLTKIMKSAALSKTNLSPPSIMKNNQSIGSKGGSCVTSGFGLNWN